MYCYKGWEHRLDIDNSDSSNDTPEPRRSARSSRTKGISQLSTANQDKIILVRKEDGVEFKIGDAVELLQKDEPAPQLCIIKQITWGTSEFILVHVVWLIRPSEINSLPDGLVKENEVFLSPYISEAKYHEFIRHINLLSEDQFDDIIIDDSNSNNTFLVRRIADDYGNFSEPFDYKEFHDLLQSNSDAFLEKVTSEVLSSEAGHIGSARQRGRTRRMVNANPPNKKKAQVVKPVSQTKTTKKETKQSKRLTKQPAKSNNVKSSKTDIQDEISSKAEISTKRAKSIRLKKLNVNPINLEEFNDSDSQSDYDAKDEDDDDEFDEESDSGGEGEQDEEVEEDEDDEFNEEELESKPRKRKSSPRKGATPSPKRKNTKQPATKKGIEELYSAVTPTKKIKYTTLDRASLPVFLSPTKHAPDSFTDPTSHAFKEMKQKLHTSQKLNALPGREDEFAMIYMNLESAVNEGTGCCVYVSGVPGMGKTATIKDVIQQMTASQANGEIKPFSYLELNGLKLLSPNVAYEMLWEHISHHKVSASNAALLLEEYFKKDEKDREPLIVLMDELDQIATKKQNVMYNFFNWPTYNTSKLIVIAVANTMDLPERVLSNKISSRLGLRRIQFRGYTFPQLGEIITHRLEMITKNNRRKVTISPDAIGFASRKVASVSGDARRALTICRRAVEIAEKQYYEENKNQQNRGNERNEENTAPYEVLISHISAAINESVNSPLAQYIGTLPFASKLALVSMLRVSKRTGFTESKLGDIIGEMKNSLVMSTDPKKKKENELDVIDILYTDKAFGGDNESSLSMNLRIHFFKLIIASLVEAGIIELQSSAGERSKLVQLNVSEEEIVSVLKRDNQITSFL